MSENLNKNLRRSLRFMVAYNQKLLAAFRKIAGAANPEVFIPYFESTRFAWPSQKILQGNWAWDFLPLAFPRLTCIKGEANKPPYAIIFVEHISDSGILRFEGDFEPSPFNLLDIDESSTIWAVRYFFVNKGALTISKDEWATDYPSLLKAIFNNENVWSYDLTKSPEFEMEKNNMKYGHVLMDATEVSSFENFDTKILKLVAKLATEIVQ